MRAILLSVALLMSTGQTYQKQLTKEYQEEVKVLNLRYQREYLYWYQYHVLTKDQRCFLSRMELLNLKYGKALSELQNEYKSKWERRR